VLRRLPNDPDDEERFDATWTVSPPQITLHITAVLDAPGPARLLRGRVERRVADDLRRMDRRLYASGPMGLAADFAADPAPVS